MVGGLSKRNFKGDGDRIKKQKTNPDFISTNSDEEFFIKLLNDSGYEISLCSNTHNTMKSTSREFIKSLEKILINPLIINDNIKKGLIYIVNNDILSICLKPTWLVTESGPKNDINEDSLIHSLLSIKSLQKHLLNILLQRLTGCKTLYAENIDNESIDGVFSMPLTILNEFRLLSDIFYAEDFLKSLIDILPQCSQEIKIEILVCLPELIKEDINNSFIILNLLTMLTSINTDDTHDLILLIPLLDTLSNMSVKEDDHGKLIQEALLNFLGKLGHLEASNYTCITLKYLLNNIKSSCKYKETLQNTKASEFLTQNLYNYYLLCRTIKESFLKNFNYFNCIQANTTHIWREGFTSLMDFFKVTFKFDKTLAEASYSDIYHSIDQGQETTYDILMWLLLHENYPSLTIKILNGIPPTKVWSECEGSLKACGNSYPPPISVGSKDFWSSFFLKYGFLAEKYFDTWADWCDMLVGQGFDKNRQKTGKKACKDNGWKDKITRLTDAIYHIYEEMFFAMKSTTHKMKIVHSLIKNVTLVTQGQRGRPYLSILVKLLEGKKFDHQYEPVQTFGDVIQDLWSLWGRLAGGDVAVMCSLLYTLDHGDDPNDSTQFLTTSLETLCQTHSFATKCITNLSRSKDPRQHFVSFYGLLHNYHQFWLKKYFSNISNTRTIILESSWMPDLTTFLAFLSDEILTTTPSSKYRLKMGHKIYTLDHLSSQLLTRQDLPNASDDPTIPENKFVKMFGRAIFDYALRHLEGHFLSRQTLPNQTATTNTALSPKYLYGIEGDFTREGLADVDAYSSPLFSGPEADEDSRGPLAILMCPTSRFSRDGVSTSTTAHTIGDKSVKDAKLSPLLCPLFRVVWKSLVASSTDRDCENENGGSGSCLNELFCLLVCPLHLPDIPKWIDALEYPAGTTEKLSGYNGEWHTTQSSVLGGNGTNANDNVDDINAVVTVIQNAINWFRELLNAFSHLQGSPYVKNILLNRVDHILRMEQYLVQILSHLTKDSILSESHYTTDDLKSKFGTDSYVMDEDSFYHALAKLGKLRLSLPKGKKSKGAKDPRKDKENGITSKTEKGLTTQNIHATISPVTDDVAEVPNKLLEPYKNARLDVYLKKVHSIRKYFRPLDPVVFDLLDPKVGSENKTRDVPKVRSTMEPAQLIFFLSELWLMIEKAYPITSTLPIQYGVKRDRFMLSLLPCPHTTTESINDTSPQCQVLGTVYSALPHVGLHLSALLDESEQDTLYARYECGLIATNILLFYLRNVHYFKLQLLLRNRELVKIDHFFHRLKLSLLGSDDAARQSILPTTPSSGSQPNEALEDLTALLDFWTDLASKSVSFVLTERLVSLAYETYTMAKYFHDAAANDTINVASADDSSLTDPYLDYCRKRVSQMCNTLLLSSKYSTANTTNFQNLSNKGGKGKSGDCHQLEQRFFFPSSTKGPFESSLTKILNIYFEVSDSPLDTLEDLAVDKINQYLEVQTSTEPSVEPGFPTLNNSFLPTYYEVMLKELIKISKHHKKLPKDADSYPDGEVLRRWNLCTRIFHILINLIKVNERKAVLVSAMRHGRTFVESFYINALPFLETVFPYHSQDICNLLKNLQRSTRYLHSVCAHSKNSKDSTLLRYVPALKKTLEIFLYKVKGMLTRNDCEGAFWLGDLKNRNLQGIEISSQINITQRTQEECEDGS